MVAAVCSDFSSLPPVRDMTIGEIRFFYGMWREGRKNA